MSLCGKGRKTYVPCADQGKGWGSEHPSPENFTLISSIHIPNLLNIGIAPNTSANISYSLIDSSLAIMCVES